MKYTILVVVPQFRLKIKYYCGGGTTVLVLCIGIGIGTQGWWLWWYYHCIGCGGCGDGTTVLVLFIGIESRLHLNYTMMVVVVVVPLYYVLVLSPGVI